MPRPLLSRYVRPEVLARIRHLPFVARQLVEGGLAGGHRSPAHGFAVEFADHREYVPGDDPKHIDWNVYYRRDRAFVKQYHQETNLVCHVVVDVSASMRYGQGQQSKLTYASHVAATLAYLVMSQGDRVSLALVDDAVRRWVAPGAGAHHLMRLTEALDTTTAVGRTSLAPPLMELAPLHGQVLLPGDIGVAVAGFLLGAVAAEVCEGVDLVLQLADHQLDHDGVVDVAEHGDVVRDHVLRFGEVGQSRQHVLAFL